MYKHLSDVYSLIYLCRDSGIQMCAVLCVIIAAKPVASSLLISL